jgi:hypothetical protein
VNTWLFIATLIAIPLVVIVVGSGLGAVSDYFQELQQAVTCRGL